MQGDFFWYDVMTTDTRAAEKFYCGLAGWTAAPAVGGEEPYTVFNLQARGVAGMMRLPDEAARKGARPGWMGYIYVDDVDAMAARIRAEGGHIHREPFEVPGVIRLAVVADPQGAPFLIAKPIPSGAPPPPDDTTPGTVGWRELYAGEWESASAFYEKLFGWTKLTAVDMGPMGTYQLFGRDGTAIGGMMTKPDAAIPAHWNYYINVAAMDAAVARLTAGGGQVMTGPHQVPGGQWVVQALDPQGAGFALVAPAR